MTGSRGQLGRELVDRARQAGLDVIGFDLPELDITDQEEARRLVDESNASVVINAAAYTAVDQAEENRDLAFLVNRDGVARLALACLEVGAGLIHVSTDYVFDGKSKRPYLETDPISPLGVYGRSKAAGDQNLREILAEHIIVRTAWLCGFHGDNFVKTMLRLGKERDEIRVVSDQYGCPTFAADLADGLLQIALALRKDSGQAWGTYHYCGAGVTSWYDFAAEIFRMAKKYDTFPARLIPIPTEEFPTLAKRPSYSVLDCGKIKKQFEVRIRNWQDGLAEMLERLFTLPK